MRIKNRFLILVLVLVSTGAGAQFKKGDRLVGVSVGSVFFNSGSSTVSFPSNGGYSGKSSSYGLRIEPTMGWFVSTNTIAGVSLNINPSGQKLTYESSGTTFQKDQSNNFTIGLGGFARNYFGSDGSFMPFGQFGFNLGISSMSTEGFRYYTSSPNYKVSYSGNSSGGFFINTSLQLGLTKMVGEHTGLDFFAGYTYSYSKNTFKTTTTTDLNIDGTIDQTAVNEPTTKFTNHGFILGVGFQIFLAKKK